MRVKVAAKLLRIAWTLMKKKAVFDPSYLSIEGDWPRESKQNICLPVQRSGGRRGRGQRMA